jgi:5-methylcytosine-specific restriction endonuclease McrA
MKLLILLGLYLYFQPTIPNVTEIFSNYYKIISILLIFGFMNLKFLKKSNYYDQNNELLQDYSPQDYQQQNHQQIYQKPMLTENRKNIIAARQSWCCNHCSNMLDNKFQLDYVIPLHKGGLRNLDNVQCLCTSCSNKKKILDISF